MFPSELTERHIKIKMNEKNMKNKYFLKEQDVVVMENQFDCVYQFSRVLNFALYIWFRPGQECASCDQIAANNNVLIMTS